MKSSRAKFIKARAAGLDYGRDWIQHIQLQRHSFETQAKRHGSTTPEFAKIVINNPGSFKDHTVQRAHLAQTFEKMKNK